MQVNLHVRMVLLNALDDVVGSCGLSRAAMSLKAIESAPMSMRRSACFTKLSGV
ncbi:hypothetical protein JCM18920_1270 [Cutibacterium acnes JCM 18920]|nr:hypothetical protein JCM18920_1270 [Cutibacterium acnes JCM 18920]